MNAVVTKYLDPWLDRLGYARYSSGLRRFDDDTPKDHPYSFELEAIFQEQGDIKARAAFEVDRVPTVVFVGGGDRQVPDEDLDRVRQGVWNQNLVSIVIALEGESARVFPAQKIEGEKQSLSLDAARADGPFSAVEVASPLLADRLPKWFDLNQRVDRKLLQNLTQTVTLLKQRFVGTPNHSGNRLLAETVMGQIMFVSYLEHRGIVNGAYREKHAVGQLHPLVACRDREGIDRLIARLRGDFNGDFLGEEDHDPWRSLNEGGFGVIDRFLSRTDMESGQGSFWNYDFSYIPVELLSGVYEALLSRSEQSSHGAYYTPRHLAVLAVDQALRESPNPLADRIFDGACGSGILLTTAFRRLVALSEGKQGRQLTLQERVELLTSKIFGADTNRMACRVTAFSLYLSLFEGIDPAKIISAQEREGVKLPTLDGTNLHHGSAGDIFSPSHGLLNEKFDLVISNPPWKEPKGDEETTADVWARRNWAVPSKSPIPLRQVAAAYNIRALDFLVEKGRVCVLLPISLLLAPTSRKFVSYLIEHVRPVQIFNFGDLDDLLFASAGQACHLFLGKLRERNKINRISIEETIDYCVPKADMGLAYGRLTLHHADCHKLPTLSISQDPQRLTAFMWGDSKDLAMWSRLTYRGTLNDFMRGPKSRSWVCRKGVHLRDSKQIPVSAERLFEMRYVNARELQAAPPILRNHPFSDWPAEQLTVAKLDEDLMRVFDGPRVLIPDGFSGEQRFLHAAYWDAPAVFSSSIGVLAGPMDDARLLRFVAVYLRSSLVQYFMVIRNWKMLCHWDAVHLGYIEELPFFLPEQSMEPELSRRALDRSLERLTEFVREDPALQTPLNREWLNEFDQDVFDYFGLTDEDRIRVRETVDVIVPSIRPRSRKSLYTLSQKPARVTDLETYANALGRELTQWRIKKRGVGQFKISVTYSDLDRSGSFGITKVDLASDYNGAAITEVRRDPQPLPLRLSEHPEMMNFAGSTLRQPQLDPDLFGWESNTMYIVRSTVRRNWTVRQAHRDAERIVRSVHGNDLWASSGRVS